MSSPLSRAEQAVTEARFVVRELGPRCFVVDDTAGYLSYDMRFTRKAAQESADWRNAASSKEPRP